MKSSVDVMMVVDVELRASAVLMSEFVESIGME